MAVAVDPTYPLYPIACVLASVMLLLVFLTSIVRQNWNLGVAFLCFWLFLENITTAINTVIWSDNADIRLVVYCDIVSHVKSTASVVKPMATLIITRRLYSIVSLRSVEPPDKPTRYKNLAFEWILGLVVPLLVTGILYYVVQTSRFIVFEGFGCTTSADSSVLAILFISSWAVIPPLISIVFYYPAVARTFYLQSREIHHFLSSNNSVSRTNYFRILVLASIDLLLTFPLGVVSISLNIAELLPLDTLPFYPGWTHDHTDWEPKSISYSAIVAFGTSNVAQFYFLRWASPVLAFAIFGLFGISPEARVSYWHVMSFIRTCIGWTSKARAHTASTSLGEIVFGEQPFDLNLKSQPSFINRDGQVEEQTVVSRRELLQEMSESDSSAGAAIVEEERLTSDDVTPHVAAERPTQHGDSHRAEVVDASDTV